MGKIRVLIVDDSVVVRRIVSDVLSGDPAFEVAGTAPNGRIALAKIPHVNPDIVTLDVEMPEMNGLETLAEIRKSYPALPVIMLSNLTERGAVATLDALSLGANDYFPKPSQMGSFAAAIQQIRSELIPKMKVFCFKTVDPSPSAARPGSAEAAAGRDIPGPQGADPGRVDIVAIGVSTGGPNALSVLMAELPADFPVPLVIVQHMPPVFTRLLAERLTAKCPIVVEEGSAGISLEPGHAWIAPGNYHMIVEKDETGIRLQTHQGPPENSCRPAVDVLFRSIAETYGPRSLALLLTGMGRDGLRGCEHIREVGGQIVVQDEATSVVWGMPGFVANAGLADKVLPLDQIAPEILRRVQVGRSTWPTAQSRAG